MMRVLFLSAALLASTVSALAEDAIPEPTQKADVHYRLFRSKNTYTLLKLDTRTGRVWQVQWGVDQQHRFVVPINLKELAQGGKTGRFTLYPTPNIYTFVLLDQEDGRAWQVQWGDENDRFIVPVE